MEASTPDGNKDLLGKEAQMQSTTAIPQISQEILPILRERKLEVSEKGKKPSGLIKFDEKNSYKMTYMHIL